MSPDKARKIPGSPDEWMDHAESDLRLAQLATGDASIRREQVCFHAQQAAEKAIKAVLLFRQVEFPLTHDIEALMELAEESGLSLPDAVGDAGLLTPYAVEARYPGSWMDITASDVQEAIETAKRTLQWAKGLIFGDKKENT
jgi:HEPN domain-containing protein